MIRRRRPLPRASEAAGLLVPTLALLLTCWTAQLCSVYLGVLHAKTYWAEPRGEPGGLLYVALGDSAAQGVGASRPGRGYVGLLAERMRVATGRPVQVVNLSRSGATVRDVLREQVPALTGLAPDVITVGVGGNDLRHFDPVAFDTDTAMLVAALPPGTIIADAPWFMHGRWERDALQASSVLTGHGRAHGLAVAPLHAAQRRQGWRSMLTQFAADLFHPNDRGHRVWAEAFWTRVRLLPVVADRDQGPWWHSRSPPSVVLPPGPT